MVDPITQSALAPLHDALFALLKMVPNDGTYDQDASVLRSQQKAQVSGCAFSFDLSAATDRLPASLSANILSCVVGVPGLGEAWRRLLVERTYHLTHTSLSEYGGEGSDKLTGGLRYSVGQPMGALSS
jgi:hypothetical protein